MVELDPVLRGSKKRKPLKKTIRIKMARGQKWLCGKCHEHMEEDDFDIHHKDGNPSNDNIRNLVAMHIKCHRKESRKQGKKRSSNPSNIDIHTKWI